jgi:hypothetical protein
MNHSDCSIVIRTLTSMLTSQTRQGFTVKRALSLLLVAFILYGTTVEAAHRHGRISGNPTSTSLITTENFDGLFTGKTKGKDCLICQLHQNFNATLISVKPNTISVDTQSLRGNTDRVPVESRINIPQSGRAPPKTY